MGYTEGRGEVAQPTAGAPANDDGAENIQADDNVGNIQADDDADSALSVPLTESLVSLRSSVLQYQVENGRTYHSMSSGKYAFPNDNQENDRLDMQHNIWLLTLHGRLCLSPKESGAKRVLDIGTGTGIWAIEYADLNPGSEVIGVDLSPIQPSLVPPNCTFEIDDLEKEWTWTKPFDFIFSRVMAGSFAEFESFINKAYAALEPGGYLEMQDLCVPMRSDDGTYTESHPLHELNQVFLECSIGIGRPLNLTETYRPLMEKAGFVDIVERSFKWPTNAWPRDKHYKALGTWYNVNVSSNLEGLIMALATRGLGWSQEETLAFCVKGRKALADTKCHAYVPVKILYGRKPEKGKQAE